MLSELNTAVTNGIIKKVVHVTSLSFSFSTGGQRLDGGGPITRLSLDSWSLQDYEDAVRCAEFVTCWNRCKTDGIKKFIEKIASQAADLPRSQDRTRSTCRT